MKKLLLIFTTAFFIYNFSFAQSGIQWQKCLGGTSGDAAWSVQQTSDGGYIVAGNSYSTDGDVTGHHDSLSFNSDFWIIKLDGSGTLLWQKCLGGSEGDGAYSIQQTADGGYVVAGYSASNDGDVTGLHGSSSDFWIVKLNASGTLQWQKCFGGTDVEIANSIQQTVDGGYIIAGETSSSDGDVIGLHDTLPSLNDFWVVKVDSVGSLQWQKCLGGFGIDEAYSIKQTLDGGFIVAGLTWSNSGDVTGFHGWDDFWIVKLDNTGALQWQKCLGGSFSEEAFSAVQTTDGGYVVVGHAGSSDGDVTSSHSSRDCWIVKLNGSGGLQWEKSLGGTDFDYGNAVRQTSDGGIIIAGTTLSNNGDVTANHGSLDWWIIKLDGSGTLQWQKSFGGTDTEHISSIEQTTDGGFIVAGSTQSNDGDVSGNHSTSTDDFWVVKLSFDVGIEKANAISQVNIFPNPVTNELRIQNAGLKIESVEMYNVFGKKVLEERFPKPIIDVSSLSNGIYFLCVKTKEKTFSQKIIISR